MSKQISNNPSITAYLLGSLDETESERFDELSITSDEFAETLKAAENDLLDAYVQGELTGAELEQFEFHYLASPVRRERVVFAKAFQVLGEKHAPEQAADVWSEYDGRRPKKTKTSSWFSRLSIFTAPRLALQWGFAALALAFLIAGGWLVFENMRLRQQMSQTQALGDGLGQRERELQEELERQRSASAKSELELGRVREERERLEQRLEQQAAQEGQEADGQRRANERQRPSVPGGINIASFVLTPQMRGVGQIPAISIPAKTGDVVMQLELEPSDYRTYRVTLHDRAGNRTLWRSGRLRAGAAGDNKTLSIRFSAGLLAPQAYVLRVSGVSANGVSEIISDYPFRVVK